MAISLYYNKSSNSLLSGMMSFLRTTASSINSLLPMAHAEEKTSYLNTRGIGCETLEKMRGAVGTPQCISISVFDTDTLNNPLNNEGFKNYVEKNTNGATSVKEKSELADFIKNTRRKTDNGITDAIMLDTIIESPESCEGLSSNQIDFLLAGESGKKECGETTESDMSIVNRIISFIINLFKKFVGSLSKSIAVLLKYEKADDTEKAKASGAYYANTEENRGSSKTSSINDTAGEPGPWEQNKWAQRYVSLNRAMESLRQYAVNYDGRVAYDIPGFEWEENPVIAYVNKMNDNVIAMNNEEDNIINEEEYSYAKEELNKLFSYLDNNPTIKEAVETELVNTYGISLNQLVLR